MPSMHWYPRFLTTIYFSSLPITLLTFLQSKFILYTNFQEISGREPQMVARLTAIPSFRDVRKWSDFTNVIGFSSSTETIGLIAPDRQHIHDSSCAKYNGTEYAQLLPSLLSSVPPHPSELFKMVNISPPINNPAEIAHRWMLLGCFINVLLLGIMITQVYLYYTTYKRDQLWMKIYVAVLFVLDVVNTVFIFVYLYRSFITFFGDFDFIEKADHYVATDPATTGLVGTMVQLFFAWRIFVLTKTWIYSAIITVLAVTAGICSILSSVGVARTPKFTEFHAFKNPVIVWLVASVVDDILITSILVWYFLRHPLGSIHEKLPQRKNKTGFQRSDMMIDRIIRVTIQTGLLTMIVAALDLLFFLIDPTGTHLLFNFSLSKLYSNSLMSSLNSRKGWSYAGTGGTQSGGYGAQSEPNVAQRHVHISSMKKPNEMIDVEGGVFVHVESHELRDIPTGDNTPDEKPRTLGSEHSTEQQELSHDVMKQTRY
ncbi:hypothetical protein NLJ89_g9161 [Agrocybe chaxingu]|uniref:DUF6534 domain-containing protein n=1 Tax=Agrocybe chaxingu TaxID=84603 RepID=A0A9W8MRH3_9AGAR|nr:hypothetical protein NLJ89_g9161 [Agrocybe chaxingu]